MKEGYSSKITDLSWLTITVKAGDREKKVSTDYYQPLWEISLLIDYLTKNLDWQEIEN